MHTFHPATVIAEKRDGAALAAPVVTEFVKRYLTGGVTDSQMAAFAMAVYFQGLNSDELAALCTAMVDSGERLRWDTARPVVDKHSTGGVGDKVSLVLAPLLATLGAAVPMLSGRGLAHTGGTLDKLESVPGVRTGFTPPQLQRILTTTGCFIAAAGDRIAPADAALYALRDHTGTVPAPELIAASIMSKKIAGGSPVLVLDIKWGAGAFCATREQGRRLAQLMDTLAADADVTFDAVLSPMSDLCGTSAGNACEVTEARAALRGGGPTDLVELTVTLAERACAAAGSNTDRARIETVLSSGEADETFAAMIAAQGGNPDAPPPVPAHTAEVVAPHDGWVHYPADAVGAATVTAGAGRNRPGGPVDHSAGVITHTPRATPVERGDVVAVVTGADRDKVDAAAAQLSAQVITDTVPAPAPAAEPALGPGPDVEVAA